MTYLLFPLLAISSTKYRNVTNYCLGYLLKGIHHHNYVAKSTAPSDCTMLGATGSRGMPENRQLASLH